MSSHTPNSTASPRRKALGRLQHRVHPTSSDATPPTPPDAVPLPPLSDRISTSNVHPQSQSPLFGTLFPELRNLIFIHALKEYDDPEHPYDQHAYYYGPGFAYAGKIDPNLLLVCRLIYLETHLAPVALNEHTFWYDQGRAPPGPLKSNHDACFARMTLQQRAAVRRVRFFTQLYWLEARRAQDWLPGLGARGFSLTITIRHTDWWYWENKEPLRIEPPAAKWGAWIGSMPRIQQFELEFESIEEKKGELEERVRVAMGWTFPLGGGGVLVHDGCAAVQSTWMGSTRMLPTRAQTAAHRQGQHTMDLKHHVRKFRFVRRDELATA